MEDCIFCKIVAGDVPCRKVYEDDDFLGFLDINPLTRGNSLIIPKRHCRWVDEVPNFGEYFEAAKVVGLKAKKGLGADWVSFITLGMEVPHAHIRVIPRYEKDLHPVLVKIDLFEKMSDAELDEIAKKIREEAI